MISGKRKPVIKNILLFFILALLFKTTHLQAANWQVITGQYAFVEFEEPFQALAENLLYLADQEIPRLAKMHGLDSSAIEHLPKARIILTDKPDISNGYALGNSVVIYALSSMYMLYWVEQAPWYYTVLTHELTHWITFKATRRKLNWFGLAANLTIPRWFYEGVAQYCAETWNLYRGDQFIRQAVLYGDLNYSALNNLNNGRLLYAAANGFVRFLAAQYGDSSLIRLFAYKKNSWYFDFGKAFESVYQKSPEILFKEFIRYSVLHYGAFLSNLPEHKFKEILPDGLMDRLFRIIWISKKDSVFLLVGKEKHYHQFVTLKLVHIRQGKVQAQKILSNNLATDVVISPDRKLLAFGQPAYEIQSDQLSLQFEWQIVHLNSLKKINIPGRFRSRYGAFDFKNNLYLVEILATGSAIHCWSSKKGMQKNWLKTNNMTFGPVTFSSKNELFLLAEKKGQRSLLRFRMNHFDSLVTNETILNLKMLNDHLMCLNVVKGRHLRMQLLDISANQNYRSFVDQFEYYFSDVDSLDRQVWAWRFEADGLRHFYAIPFDSLKKSQTATANQNKYGYWQEQAPVLNDSVFKSKQFDLKKKRFKSGKKRWPFFPMENILNIALPFYDPSIGAGVYGFTAWIEALQRQMIAGAFYIAPNSPDKSLATLQHSIRVFNLEFNSGLYHGPVIFAFKDQEWVYLVEDNYFFTVTKYLFPGGNGRWKMSVSARYNYFGNRFVEKQQGFPHTFHYQGPVVSFSIRYQLPTRRGISFPVRYFNFRGQIFNTLWSDYAFKILESDLTWGGELFLNRMNVWQQVTFLKQSGKLPPLKTVGLDRFYQLELPRDYTYTRTIRGVNEDVLTDQLFWSSTEIRYLIKEKTPYKLIFIPVNLLSVDIFFDYARLGTRNISEISSFGVQLSMAESLMRLSAGIARSFIDWQMKSTTYYLRFTALLQNVAFNHNRYDQ